MTQIPFIVNAQNGYAHPEFALPCALCDNDVMEKNAKNFNTVYRKKIAIVTRGICVPFPDDCNFFAVRVESL